jgi:hypothetical protein
LGLPIGMQITDEVTADGKAKNADFELRNRNQSDSEAFYEYRWKRKKLSN